MLADLSERILHICIGVTRPDSKNRGRAVFNIEESGRLMFCDLGEALGERPFLPTSFLPTVIISFFHGLYQAKPLCFGPYSIWHVGC
jgi:hypothetical protein